MFQMPEQYHIKKEFEVKSVIPKGLKAAEKKRMQDSIKRVNLEWQLGGEQIPSRVDEEINCKVIMFFAIELTNLKHASFIANILQQHLKGFVILRIYDKVSEIYSFAIKRLHLTQKDEVVVEEAYLTNTVPIAYTHAEKNLLMSYTAFDAIQNKLDKYNVYLEIATKAYVISHAKAFQRFKELLNYKQVWLDKVLIKDLLIHYNQLVDLKNAAIQQTKASDKIKMNAEIKQQLNYLYSLLEG